MPNYVDVAWKGTLFSFVVRRPLIFILIGVCRPMAFYVFNGRNAHFFWDLPRGFFWGLFRICFSTLAIGLVPC